MPETIYRKNSRLKRELILFMGLTSSRVVINELYGVLFILEAPMKIVSRLIVAIVFICLFASSSMAASPLAPVHIYLDADMTGARSSTVSIERGIRTALAENGNRLGERPVELIVLNHRGNSARSLANLKKYLADQDALVVFAGLHSPPLLAHRQFINDNHILLLDPWAAAWPITRPPDNNHWIFRLSVDDSKAGEVIVHRAIDQREFKNPALLLENTGWGKSNSRTMRASLGKRGITPTQVSWFDWGLKETGAKIMLRNIKESGADVIFMVANAPEGKVLCKAMHDLPESERLPIVSHWGITGGDFPQVVSASIRETLDLEFIQTRFSFFDMGDAPFPNSVFKKVGELFPEVAEPVDITAPTGFIHGYDLTRLLIAAVRQEGLTGDIKASRSQIRNALENLEHPVQGLVKVYIRPFRPYSVEASDAHEALGIEDFTFGKYDKHDAIILIKE